MKIKAILAILAATICLWSSFYIGHLYGSEWWGLFPLIMTTLYSIFGLVLYAITEFHK